MCGKHITALLVSLSLLSGALFAQNSEVPADDSEISVEDAYLQSFENMIIKELADSDGRDNKMVALQYINNALDRGDTSAEMHEALESLALEGISTVAREGNRVVNNYPDVRARACEALGRLGTEEAKDTLIEVLNSENEPMVATEAIRALGNMGINNNDETTEMIAWIGRKFNIINPTSSMALEILDAFVQIAEEARACAALLDAGRQLALGDALLAERALLHDALLLVEVAHAVGAGHGAELAADALRLVDLHGAVGGHVRGLGRADGHAGRVRAVLALDGQEVGVDVRPLAALLARVRAHAQDLVPVVAHRNVVDDLAPNRARQAADALVEVSQDGITRHHASPLGES